MATDKKDSRVNLLRCGAVLLIFAVLIVPSISNWSSRRGHDNALRTMSSFQYVDEIHVTSASFNQIFNADYYQFALINRRLDPFQDGRMIVSAGARRSLQNQSLGRFAEIAYYRDGIRQFSVNIYTFASRPLPEGTGGILDNVFMVGDYFAVAFVDGSNLMCNFGRDAIFDDGI